MKKQKLVIVMMALSLPLMNIASAARLMFSGADTMIKDCPTTVDIYLDTQDEEIGTAGVNILLDKANFIVNEFESSNGIFRNYPGAKILTARKGDVEGQDYLRLIGTTSSPNGFQGAGLFGTLTITPVGDQVSLNFYMIPGYEGEDSNLALRVDGNVTDALTEVENKVISVTEGECTVKTLGEIEIEEVETSVFADKTQDIIEENLDLNEENIFDKSQETNRIKKNINYLAIAAGLIILAIIIVLATRKKKDK